MEVDEDNTVEDTQMAVAGSSSSAGEGKKRFEVKKVRASAARARAVARRAAAGH